MDFILGAIAGLFIEFKFNVTGFIWAWIKSKFPAKTEEE